MNVYDELKIKKLINAAGTYTVIGGSKMSETTLEKMNEAARSYVEIKDLQKAIHERLALLTNNESCVISAGGIVGIYLCLASAISMKYKKQFKHLKKSEIEKAEIIMFKAHRNPYDRSVNLIGCKLVELGYANTIDIVDEETLENAFTENTCAVFYLPSTSGGWVAPGALDLQTTIQVSKKHHVPVIVDAAAQLPPKSNLWYFTEELGADAVIFSGGKYLKGPQSTGVILGKKDLLDWVNLHNFPNYDIGRMHKISREELVGIYNAVKEYVQSDEDEERNQANWMVNDLIQEFSKSNCFSFEDSYPNEAGQPMSRAKMIIHHSDISLEHVRDYLLSKEQPIYTKIDNGFIYINPMMLSIDDYRIVKNSLLELQEEYK
ncbi:aminotransferase class V-fold PLP-dependent enzyme [Anaerorhabdus sp.]|uniref:aminotransferase class V-fold PLP-dependent enzyme n=1 Tax=Anaerorhabdus sp. TaxID=1872524 RepID=UPI002FCA31DD